MNDVMLRLIRYWFSRAYPFICDDVLNWLYCMAHLETGNFKSAIYRKNGNLFGMKKANCRLSTSNGVNRNHAVYSDFIESVHDLMLWFCYNRFYQTDFMDIQTFVSKFRKTHYNPKMDSYVSSINQLFIKFFSYDGTF